MQENVIIYNRKFRFGGNYKKIYIKRVYYGQMG